MWLRWALSLPFVIAMGVTGAFVTSEALGIRPWSDPSTTMSEAAAQRDAAVLRRMLFEGVDPTTSYRMRDRQGRQTRGTPLEAAALYDRPEMIRLLEHAGVPIDERERTHLLCLAMAEGARAAAEWLARDGFSPACEQLVPQRSSR